MRIICLDLEGVLVPEIWISLANRTKIEGLRLTTRDIKNYDELMAHRLNILRKKQSEKERKNGLRGSILVI